MPDSKIRRFGDPVEGIPFFAVALHPLADETTWLRENGARPEDCTHVDLYWQIEDRVAFVSISAGMAEGFANYYQRADLADPDTFYVTTQAPMIGTRELARILSALQGWIEADPSVFESEGPYEPRRILSADLAASG